MRLKFVFAVSLAAVVLSASLAVTFAGWSYRNAAQTVVAVPLGGEEATPFGLSMADTMNTTLAAIEVPLSTGELNTLASHPPFNTMPSTNIMAKIVTIRRAVLEAIDTIGLSRPELADCLMSLYRNRRICLAFGGNPSVAAEIREDGAASCGDEAMNLYRIPCPTNNASIMPLYDPEMFRLMNTLSHEGLHAIQAGYAGPDPNTQQLQASWALTNQCREVEASQQEVDRMTNMVLVLNDIKNNLRIPDGMRGLPARIGGAILNDPNLTPAQKRRKACDLLAQIQGDLLPKVQQTLACRSVYKQALEHFLAGRLTSTTAYNDIIKTTGWYSHTGIRELPEFRLITLLVGGDRFVPNTTPPRLETDRQIRQISVDVNAAKTETTFTAEQFESISGAWRSADKFWLAGHIPGVQAGVIRGYRDTDADGLIEGTTSRELFRSMDFYGGFALTEHPITGKPWGFNRRTNRLYEFLGSDADGFPTSYADRGTLGTGRKDLLHAGFSANGAWVLGAADFGIPLGKYSVTAEARLNASLNTFDPYRLAYPFAETEQAPALSRAPWPDSTFLPFTATPGGTYNAYRLDEMGMTMLGWLRTDPHGYGVFNLQQGLAAGDQILISNGGWSSPIYTVPDQRPAEFFDPRRTSANRLQIQAFLEPDSAYALRYTHDLKTWEPLAWESDAPPYASSAGNVFAGISTMRENTKLVAGYSLPRIAEVREDFYRVSPGTDWTFYPSYNDYYRAGALFELTPAPDFHADRFKFDSRGFFDLAALFNETTVRLDYRVGQGTDFTPMVGVSILVDYGPLINPPVILTNGVEMVNVSCLVLGGKHYPKYQFRHANNPTDVCKEPHWHAHSLPFPLEAPASGLQDPDPASCGYGREKDVPTADFLITLEAWQDFKIAHIPPI